MSTVLLASPFAPPEWVVAHGLTPRGLVGEALGHRHAAGLSGVCPYARSLAETALAADADAVVLATACDQQRRLAEWVAHESRRETFILHTPAVWQSPAARRHFADELARLGRFLQRLGGTAPDADALAQTLRTFDDARARLRALRGTVAPSVFAEALRAYWERPGEFVQQGPTGYAGDGESPADRRGVGLALLGGPLLRHEWRIFAEVEALGGAIVLDATDSGERMLPAPLDRRRLALEGPAVLAEAYLGLPAVFHRPNSELYRWLGGELRGRGVRGLVLRRFVWCDLWHAELQRLRDWAGLPVLDLELDTADAATGRWASRLEPFVEVVGRTK